VDASARNERLERACLYLILETWPGGRDALPIVEGALRGGVDVVQLREKDLSDGEIVAAGRRLAAACARAGALFVLNDRPDLAAACDADGVHVGQDDAPVDEARRLAGAGRLVGLSTHSPEQIDAASGVDYIGVGPIWETSTKPGRPAVGLDLVAYAATATRLPWFAIGGVDATNVEAVRRAGATRVAVVRAIRDAGDPEVAARDLRHLLVGRQPAVTG
jgi:thiamine-phosphate pyrophosphorylase